LRKIQEKKVGLRGCHMQEISRMTSSREAGESVGKRKIRREKTRKDRLARINYRNEDKKEDVPKLDMIYKRKNVN
jgi:hypothetical protein